MRLIASLNKIYSRAPKVAILPRTLIELTDRLLDKVYSSQYNPLYQSGTLAIGLLLLVLITGVYLLFFYRLSTPYESLVNIQNQIFLGRWIRALHRYASDAAVVAVFFHVMRMLAEGKTWGPRFLAWISGVAMLAMMFLTGWTGFILVWDRVAQSVAVAGAHIFDLLPVLSEPVSRAFSGVTPLAGSFFFMNLFLHIAIPLGLIVALWIHTSKLARSLWWPHRFIMWGAFGALFLLSVLWPAPLAKQADVLASQGIIPLNLFYLFWIPVNWYFSPVVNVFLWGGFFLFFLSIPIWWRPSAEQEPEISVHDEEKCEGCKQCVLDCPFEAIQMVPRTKGTGSELVAHVTPELCVSCGICAGSCSQFAIGPVGRSGRDQLTAVKDLKVRDSGSLGKIVFLHCGNNPSSESLVVRAKAVVPHMVPFSVDCLGSVHPGVVTSFLTHFEKVIFLGCPPRLCRTREGVQIANDRVLQGRNPGLPARVDLKRILFINATSSDAVLYEDRLKSFVEGSEAPMAPSWWHLYAWRSVLMTALFLLFLGFFSALPAGRESQDSFLRTSWRLSGQVVESCRDLTPAELQTLPLHMRKSRECRSQAVSYDLQVSVDGKIVGEKTLTPKGMRSDRPLYVDEQWVLPVGQHEVIVKFKPHVVGINIVSLEYSFKGSFERGRAILVSYNSSRQALYHQQ